LRTPAIHGIRWFRPTASAGAELRVSVKVSETAELPANWIGVPLPYWAHDQGANVVTCVASEWWPVQSVEHWQGQPSEVLADYDDHTDLWFSQPFQVSAPGVNLLLEIDIEDIRSIASV